MSGRNPTEFPSRPGRHPPGRDALRPTVPPRQRTGTGALPPRPAARPRGGWANGALAPSREFAAVLGSNMFAQGEGTTRAEAAGTPGPPSIAGVPLRPPSVRPRGTRWVGSPKGVGAGGRAPPRGSSAEGNQTYPAHRERPARGVHPPGSDAAGSVEETRLTARWTGSGDRFPRADGRSGSHERERIDYCRWYARRGCPTPPRHWRWYGREQRSKPGILTERSNHTNVELRSAPAQQARRKMLRVV